MFTFVVHTHIQILLNSVIKLGFSKNHISHNEVRCLGKATYTLYKLYLYDNIALKKCWK